MLELTKENFEETTKEGNVILDFWAPWCGPCRIFAPVFEETAGELPDYKFAKVNTEDNPELAQEFGIRSIPTLLFLSNGQEVGRVSGALPKDQFKAKIGEFFNK